MNSNDNKQKQDSAFLITASLKSLRTQEGVDTSSLCETLGLVLKYDYWKVAGAKSFKDYITSELFCNYPSIKHIINLIDMQTPKESEGKKDDKIKSYRAMVKNELIGACNDDNINIDLSFKGNRHSKSNPSASRITGGTRKTIGTDDNAAYIIARLNRDGETELSESILMGEVTAHSVAVEKGWRPPKATINLANPSSAANTIKKKCSEVYIRDLIRFLNS